MSKKKKVVISILILSVALTSLFLLLRTPEWSPPSSDWWLAFDSIEEITEIRRLLNEGNQNDLLSFIEGTNNGENVIRNRRDIRYFLDIIDETVLLVDPNWVSLAYDFGIVFVRYDLQGSGYLSFTTMPRGGDETFDEVMDRISVDNDFLDITAEITSFSNQNDFRETSLRIGNGVEALSFYNQFGDYSIREWEDGFEVRVSLNIEGISASIRIDNAPTLESAFEILANVEFARGGGWFDSE